MFHLQKRKKSPLQRKKVHQMSHQLNQKYHLKLQRLQRKQLSQKKQHLINHINQRKQKKE